MSATITVSVAQALASQASGLHVLDSAADIAAALPNPGLVARVVQFTQDEAATITAGQAEALAGLGGKFQRNGETLVVKDTVADLASAANAAGVALATGLVIADTAYDLLRAPPALLAKAAGVVLTGTPTLTVAQLGTLHALPNFSLDPGSHVQLADSTTAINGLLATNPGWFAGIPNLVVQLDNAPIGAYAATQLVGLEGHGTAVRFAATSVSSTFNVAARAQDLASNAAALATLEQQVSVQLTVSNPGTALSVAQANALLGLPGFSVHAQALSLADTGANLFAAAALFQAGFTGITVTSGTLAAGATVLLSAGLSFATGAGCRLAASASLTAAQANALAALPHVTLGQGVTLTVSDTVSALTGLSPAALALATGEQLSGPAWLTPAQAASLAALPHWLGSASSIHVQGSVAQYAAANGWQGIGPATVTVVDNAADLAAAAAGALLQNASSVVVSGAATLSIAQAVALASIPHLAANGETLTVTGTAQQAAQAATPLGAIASIVTITDAGPLTAAQAEALAGLQSSGKLVLEGGLPQTIDSYANLAAAGNMAALSLVSQITVRDTGANLALAVAHDWGGATPAYELSADSVVSAAQLTALAASGAAYSANGHVLAVSDSADGLLGLSAPAQALADAEVLNTSAVVSAATLASLAARPGFALAQNVTLVAQDNAAALLALTAPQIAAATGFALSGPATVSVAGFLTLRDTLHVPEQQALLTITGSAADLASLAGGDLALASAELLNASAVVSASQANALAQETGFSTNGYTLDVADSAQALAGLSGPAVALAAAIALNANATVNAAVLTTLAGFASFSRAGHALVVADSATALLALDLQAQDTATAATLTGAATLTAAQADMLADIPALSLGQGASLTVLDSASGLLSLSNAALSLASACLLAANGTVSAAQADVLAAEPGFSTNGHALTVISSAAGLLGLSVAATADAAVLALSASQSVSAAQLTSLASFGSQFSLAGHVLTVTDTPAALLALAPNATALASALVLSGNATISAAQAGALAALGDFSLGGHVLTVMDSADALAALSAPAASLAGSIVLDQSASVPASEAALLASLPGFSLGNGVTLTVVGDPQTLLALPQAVTALATGYALTAGGTVTASEFVTLRDTLQVSANGHSLVVEDTAAGLASLAGSNLGLAAACLLSADAMVSVSTAVALAGEPGFSANGHTLDVLGSATDLLGLPQAVLAVATQLVLDTTATVSTVQLEALAALGTQFSADGHGIAVTGTPAQLLALSPAAQALATAEALGANATVNAAMLTSLASVSDFTTAGHSLIVTDTADALAALAAPALALASAEVLSQSATVSAAEAAVLAGLPNFSLGSASLTIAGTAAQLLALPNTVTALATGYTLTANATVNVSAFETLRDTLHAASGGYTLTLLDSASALASVAGSNLSLVSACLLDANATVSAATATLLAGEPGFSANGYGLTVSDGAAALLGLPAPALADASALVLNADQTVTPAQLTGLAALGGVFSTGGHVLIVSGQPADLLALSPSAQALAGSLALSANATVSALTLTQLAGLGNFSLSGHTLTVADTADNLASLSGSPALSLAAAETLSQSATVNISEALTLATLPAFSLGNGVTLTVSGSAAQLLSVPQAVSAIASAYVLNANATVDVSDFEMLRDTLHVASGGYTLTLLDSADALATLAGSDLSLISTCLLSANATISAAEAASLAGEPGFSAHGHTLTVSDSASAILALSGSALAAVSAVQLNADQTVTTAQLESLAALGGLFSANGHAITVAGTANSLLALSAPAQALATSEALAADATVNAAALTGLAGIGDFTANGHIITVSDTADALAALGGPALALASAEVLSQSATVSATEAATLAALPNLSLGAGVTLTVADTAAALLALPGAVTALATGYALTANATVSATAFETLRDTLHVAADGHSITLQDSAGALAALSGSDLNLVSACLLSANATVSAAEAASLAGEPGFSTNGYTLTVSDSAAAILGLSQATLADVSSVVLNADQTVSPAQLEGLAALGSLFSTGGHALVVSGQPADLLALSQAALALCGGGAELSGDATVNVLTLTELANLNAFSNSGYAITVADTADHLAALAGAPEALFLAASETLDQSATVGISEALTLSTLPAFSLGNGVTLTVSGSAAQLLSVPQAVSAIASAYVLNANATVDVSDFEMLRDTLHVASGGYTLTLLDSADALATLAGSDLSLVSACLLSANATISAAEAASLAGEPGFSANGHTLTVSDSASAILALSGSALAAVSAVQLNADQTVTTTQLEGLAALSTLFSANGHAITVAGTANSLLALSAPAQALATSEALAADATVSAAALTSLASIGDFTANGHIITVSDTADALTALGGPALALASAEVLSQSATVSAAEAAMLASLPNIALGAGVSLIVSATAATILTLPQAVTALATGYALAADATVDASDFATLRDTYAISDAGHTLTVLDSAAALAALAGGSLSLITSAALDANATVGYADADALASLPGFTANGYSLIVADSAANLLALSPAAMAAATLLELNGDQLVGASQLTALAALGSQFSANGHDISVQGSTTELLGLAAPALALATAELLDSSATVSAATAISLVALGNFSLSQGVTLTVDDTAQALLTLPQSVTAIATGYGLSADATVDAADFASLRSLGVAADGHSVTVSDSATALLGLAGSNLSLATSCTLNADANVSMAQALLLAAEPGFSTDGHTLTISTSGATLAANLAALVADFTPATLAISLTDQTPVVSVSAATYAADSAVLDRIISPGAVVVTGDAPTLGGLAATLAADAVVSAVQVTDTATNVANSLASLLAIGNKLSVTLSDSVPFAAALVPYLALLPSVSATVGVSDTAAQIAAVVEQDQNNGTTAATTLLESLGATLSGNSQVAVSDVAALQVLGSALHLNGYAINVVDSVSHLTASGTAALLQAAVQSGLISTIYVRTNGATVTVTVAQLTTLVAEGVSAQLPSPYSGALALTLRDTAANLAAAATAITTAHGAGYVGSVVVSASATISDTQLAALQGLSAVAATGALLTVSDAAATIATHAASQASGQSVAPSAWVLNANASVTAAQAVTLAQLSGFATGGHVLTLSNSASVTVSQADALAAISPSIALNAHTLTVAGSVASLGGLSAAALALVTPALSDQFSAIAALSPHSALLGGTVTITDSETITVDQATSFLNLLTVNGGALATGSVSFGGNTESLAGSVAQLQALASSTAWINATALHGDFALTAQDSVAALTNAASTAFLASIAGSTLAADATVTASQAETLATLAPQINFSLGGHALIIQDSAADILNMANAAGLALATEISVTQPATLDAASAETLLSVAHVSLAAPLTIQDSSSALLDGVLGPEITASGLAGQITVTLAAPETLDAQTASELVALPGFSNAVGFTIADDPSYLLASANLTAEQLASSVTLDEDITASASTILRLSELPHFTAGSNMVTLASNDYADDATLKAIGDLGGQFSDGGHTIRLTADALDLTPTEYAAIQNDGIVANGHVVSAVLVNDSVTDMNNIMALTATGVAGATVNVYGASGMLLSSNPESNAGFTVTAPDTGMGGAFAITEVVNGVESAPVVVLESSVLETAATAAGASFASSGAIAVDSGKYINLYTAGSVPQNLTVAALVYDPTAHTISLDLPSTQPITLITLGSSTHPAALDSSEILVKHHG